MIVFHLIMGFEHLINPYTYTSQIMREENSVIYSVYRVLDRVQNLDLDLFSGQAVKLSK